jgi:hypothetical protein
MRWGGLCWIELAQDEERWRAVVNTAINIQIPRNAGNVAKELLVCCEGLCVCLAVIQCGLERCSAGVNMAVCVWKWRPDCTVIPTLSRQRTKHVKRPREAAGDPDVSE